MGVTDYREGYQEGEEVQLSEALVRVTMVKGERNNQKPGDLERR